MEFLLYLTPVGHQILTGVLMKNFKVQENAPLCQQQKQTFGYVNSPDFIVCLDNIKNTISPVKHYVNETVYHETVHVIQSCIGQPIGIKNPILSPEKLQDVIKSTQTYGSSSVYEVEAYYLEDKPEEVNRYLKKYCF